MRLFLPLYSLIFLMVLSTLSVKSVIKGKHFTTSWFNKIAMKIISFMSQLAFFIFLIIMKLR